MTAYNFGAGHPMAPERMDLTARLSRSLGLFDLDHVELAAPEVASDAALESVHSPDYVAAVRRVSADPTQPDEARGLAGLVILETNTQPGMTPTSLAPEQAAAQGISFPDLCRWIVEDASCSR